MEKCFICGQECYKTLFKANRFLQGINDSITGESFDLCTNCARKYNTPGTVKIMYGIKQQGVRWALRSLNEANALSKEDTVFINTETVNILSKKYMRNCTGFIVYNFDQYILFDEDNGQVLLNCNTVCSFNDIIDYKVLNHSVDYNVHSPESTEYSTESKNAIGRAFLGKILAGTSGAVVGGLTAKHSLSVERSGYSSYTTTSNDYSIVIHLRKLGNSSVILSIGKSEEEMTVLCNMLDTIISLNNK